MLNDGFVITMAQHFAERVSAGGGDRAAQIDRAFAAALGRAPNAAERQTLEALARQHGMANACRVLFNLNEFTFVD
jgi:hypothetical protein